MSIFNFTVVKNNGEEISMSEYKGKVLIIVNTASKCGFTPQYETLQKLYDTYKAGGLEILAFPSNQFMWQEPGTDDEILNFCKMNYGVTFGIFRKIDVRGLKAHPLFKFITGQKPFKGSVKWNFTKFLVDREGRLVARYEPTASPLKMEEEIKRLLAQ